MSEEKYLVSGVDIIDERYYLCLLDAAGKHPRYYRGRVDTAVGQAKLLEYLGVAYVLVIVESPLAMLLLAHLGSERVVVAKEGEHYSIWERAGVERGNAMARFAATLYYDSLFEPQPLSDREYRLLLLAEEERIRQDFQRVHAAQELMQQILSGEAPPDAFDRAIALLDKSPLDDPSHSLRYETSSDEDSFITLLTKALKK